MASRWRQWWPIVKLVLALVIIGAVGWRFAAILRRPELWQESLDLRPGWLAAAAALYLIGLCCWGGFWHWLLWSVGEQPPLAATARTYFIGHLGKYIPGKAWNLLLRTGLMYEAGVRPGVAALTATYEALTTMAAGALLAAVLLAVLASDARATWWALALLALLGIAIVPGVFNLFMKGLAALAGRVAQRFGSQEAAPLPRVTFATLLLGLGLTSVGWLFLGLSFWSVITAIVPEPPALTLETWARYTAFVALAYVAGFLAIVTPGGLGVRELFLEQLLLRDLGQSAAPLIVVIVLVLRLLWAAAEVMMAAIVWWLPAGARNQKSEVGSQKSETLNMTPDL